MAYIPSSVIEAMKKYKEGRKTLSKIGYTPGEETDEPKQNDTPVVSEPAKSEEPINDWWNKAKELQDNTSVNDWWNKVEDKINNGEAISEPTSKAEETINYIRGLSDKGYSGSRTDDAKNNNKATKNAIDKAKAESEQISNTIDINTDKYSTKKFAVQTIDAVNKQFAVDSANVEVWYIGDGTGLHSSQSLDGMMWIGRDSLDGAQEGADYVIYNRDTKQIYQYAQDASASKVANERDKENERYNKMRLTTQQKLAADERSLNELSDRLATRCEKLGIDLEGELTDEQYALIQELIDQYVDLQSQMDFDYKQSDKNLQLCQNRMAWLDNKQEYKNKLSVQDATQYDYYKEIWDSCCAVRANKMSRKEFAEKYNMDYSTELQYNYYTLYKAGEDAVQLSNGLLYDRDGAITKELNSYAQGLKKTDDDYLASFGSGDRLNMQDNKQMNSSADVVRAYLANKLYNKGYTGNCVQTGLGIVKDIFEVMKVHDAEIAAGDDKSNGWFNMANLSTGLSGVVLNEMTDWGNLLTSAAQAVSLGRGFVGEHTGYNVFSENQLMNNTYHDTYYFTDGAVQHLDYYKSKYADGGKFAAWKTAMEMQLRGDVAMDLNPFGSEQITTFRQYDKSDVVENLSQFYDEHPVVKLFGNIGVSILADPTTWTGLAETKVTALKGVKLESFLTDKVDDFARNFERITGKTLSDAQLNAVQKQLRKCADDALKLGSNIKADDYAGIMGDLMKSDEELLAMSKWAKKQNVENMIASAEKAISEVADNEATKQLWKDLVSVNKLTNTVEYVDKSLNTIQFGLLGVAGQALKPAYKLAKEGITALKMSSKVEPLLTNLVLHKNNILYTIAKKLDKGVAGIEDTIKLTDAVTGSAVMDAYKHSIKTGQDVTQHLDELNKYAHNTVAAYSASLLTNEVSVITESIIKASRLGELLTSKFNNIDELEDILRTRTYINDDTITRLIGLSNGMEFREYIDYLTEVAKKVDNIDAANSVQKELNSEITRMQHYINKYNNAIASRQCMFAKMCIDSDDIARLRNIDMSNIAPDLQDKLSKNINILINNKNNTLAKSELDSIIKAYADRVDITERAAGRFKIYPTSDVFFNNDIKSVSPQEYIETAFRQAGVECTQEQIDRVLKESISAFGKENPELVGKYYVFKEGAEANWNGVLRNEELNKLMFDDKVLDTLEGGSRTQFMDIRNTLDNARCLQDELAYSLGTGYEYHAIMDTISGSDDTVNELFYKMTNTWKDNEKAFYRDQIIDYIIEHTRTIQKIADDAWDFADEVSTRRCLAQSFNMIDAISKRGQYCVFTRESVYSVLMDINDRLVKAGEDELVKKFESAINAGAYTTDNTGLGSIVSNATLNKAIADACGVEGYNVNHIKALMEVTNGGEMSLGLRTMFNADNAAQWVSKNIINNLIASNHNSLFDELNDYCNDLTRTLERVGEVKYDLDTLNNVRRYINVCAQNCTHPVELRYLDYFNSIKFDDSSKAIAAIVDIEERLGIDDSVIAGLAGTEGFYDSAKVVQDKAKWIYKGEHLDTRLLKTDAQDVYDARQFFNYSEVAKTNRTMRNSNQIRQAMLDIYAPDDIASKVAFEARMRYVNDLDIFDNINSANVNSHKELTKLRGKQVKVLREFEDNLWNSNIARVQQMGKDELDKMLLCNAGNAIVCDIETYPQLTEWLAAHESQGYIVTNTVLNDKNVSILSLDLSTLSNERREFLKRAQQVARENDAEQLLHMIQSADDNINDLRDNMIEAYDRFADKLGTGFKNSAVGSRNDVQFLKNLQDKLPVNCQLTAQELNMHKGTYMNNMLCTNQLAHECGAVKGHVLGNWYYAAVSGMNTVDETTDLVQCLNHTGNTLQAYAERAGLSIDASAELAELMRKDKLRLVKVDTTHELANGMHNIRVREIATHNYNKYADAIVIDEQMYKYLIGEANSANRAVRYLTTPKALYHVLETANDIRSAYITGQLYMANIGGTAFRNVVDSNTKALAELTEAERKNYFKYYTNMIEYQDEYVRKMADVYSETGMQGTEAIQKWLHTHPEESTDLIKWHTCFTLTETADDDLAKVFAGIDNKRTMQAMKAHGLDLFENECAEINKIFAQSRDAMWRKHWTDAERYDDLVKRFRKSDVILKGRDNQEELITKLANMYGDWEGGNAQRWYTKMFDADNPVGAVLSKANKQGFDNAEARCRNAMMMAMMDEGESAISANMRVVKTQFDYSTRLGLQGKWDKIMPFAKYQFSNAAYWLDTFNYSAFTGANMRRLSQVTNGTKSTADTFKQEFLLNYMKNSWKDSDSSTVIDTTVNPLEYIKQSLSDTIEDYKGTPNKYISGARVSDHRYIKCGNGFMDTLDWLGTVLAAPSQIAKGQVPDLIQNTLFSPIKTLGKASKYVADFFGAKTMVDKAKAIESMKKYAGDNLYDVMGLIPVYGNLTNVVITQFKNLRANEKLFALAYQDAQCRSAILEQLGMITAGLGFTIFNSIVGLTYDNNRKVFTAQDGKKWSDLTDEEKKGYYYINGISDKAYYAATPLSYFGLKARLADFGLSKDDIKKLTDKTNWKNNYFLRGEDGSMYIDTRAMEATIISMLENGYAVSEILYLMQSNTKWYDMATHTIISGNNGIERQFLNSVFLKGYQMLPDYIKYQPEMYAEMIQRYKALGMSTEEAWRYMRTNFEYIAEDGNLTKLTPEQVVEYNKWLAQNSKYSNSDPDFFNWYNQLPEYIRYEKGAYSRTLAYLKQMFDAEEAKQMIANGAYYTVDGRLINCKDLTRAKRFTKSIPAFQDENGYWHKGGDFQVDGYWFHKGDNPYLGLGSFSNYWNTLPDFMKYTKGAWSQTNKVMKDMGLDYNTRMIAMQQGAYAMKIDPNSDYFKQMLANQEIEYVTKTVYVSKQVPLRECSLVNGQWVWNGAQIVKCNDLGNGYTETTITKQLEVAAAGLGVGSKREWTSYDAAMVTVQVPTTVVEAVTKQGDLYGTIHTMPDGSTYIIVPCPPYINPRRGYPRKGSPYTRQPKKYNKRYSYGKPKSYEKIKRYKPNKYYFSQKPMTISYSNVNTFSKQHFLQQQGTGYKYWCQWGDGRITNHRNRSGRVSAPSTYRNPLSRKRNMYKDLYVGSQRRMNMRQNIAGYSNACITRFRRNEIANRTANIRRFK